MPILHKRAPWLLGVALLAAFVAVPPIQAAGSPTLRGDGIYDLALPGEGGAPLHHVVRFYSDGTAVEATISGDPKQKDKWISRDDPALAPGRWTLEDGHVVLKRSTGFKETRRSGTLSEAGWVIIGDKSDKIVFKFVPLAFPRAAGSGNNRRPFFIGEGKATRQVKSDAAGNPAGVHHELEIEARDPDGDPVKITWTPSNGTIVGDGAKVVWEADGPGNVIVALEDGKGGRTESRIDLD